VIELVCAADRRAFDVARKNITQEFSAEASCGGSYEICIIARFSMPRHGSFNLLLYRLWCGVSDQSLAVPIVVRCF